MLRFMLRSPATHVTKCLALRRGSIRLAKEKNINEALSLSLPSKCSRFMSSTTDPSGTAFSGNNASYMDAMYDQWKQDPTSVHASWQAYFGTGSYQAPPTLGGSQPGSVQSPVTYSPDLCQIADSIKLVQLARAFQVRGSYVANIDPLQLTEKPVIEELNPEYWGFLPSDLDRTFDTSFVKSAGLQNEEGMTLRQIVERFEEVYCHNIGYQYMHIADTDICDWIRGKIETREEHSYSKKEKLRILDRMTWAEEFEMFLAKKQSTAKRFGLEGGESCIPGVKAAIVAAGRMGVKECVIGMPHRGRLNVLATVLRKPLEEIFYDFNPGSYEHSNVTEAVTGDVKYHLGFSHTREQDGLPPVHLSLVANPSHLEAVNPVVCGKVRAKQFYRNDSSGLEVMGILFHGDAAMAGQGVVYETMGMSQVEGYKQGGTFHLIVNNQIGFTTPADQARSMEFCSDLGKSLNCPIFRVNGDDPEAVSWVCELAAEFRCKFLRDVIVDVVCYRRHGHNEIDEPMFTQPKMYQEIKKHVTTLNLYRQKLLEEDNGITAEEIQQVTDNVISALDEKYIDAQSFKPSIHKADHLSKRWSGMSALFDDVKVSHPYGDPTGIDVQALREIGTKLSTVSDDFNLHRRIKQVYSKKLKTIEAGSGIDWGTAEALAFGSLLQEGTHVRLSGEDVERGTFSHRHCVLVDQKNEIKYTPLNNLSNEQAYFSVHNSILSEYGVLGFELGYSMEDPNALVLWEAQFGDFVNGAQIMLDNFISCGEAKWLRQNGLVMLLPHGYEGQGPEHSSARIERFLQGCNDDPHKINKKNPVQLGNWNIVNCTTPANYFHILRRQIKRRYRKPLVVFSPKQLLRFPLAVSSLEEMGPETRFRPVISDQSGLVDDKVTKLIACSGKVYYDIIARRAELGRDDVAVIRFEQLFPFPYQNFQEQIAKYPNAKIAWCQEEPMNMGPWTFIQPRIRTAYMDTGIDLPSSQPAYFGRMASASTSTGKLAAHEYELDQFLTNLFKD